MSTIKKYDFNCFTGDWPFHEVRYSDFASLCSIHRKNGITGGFVSSARSIFYNDPYEAEQMLARELKDYPEYRHVMTVNPNLPGTENSIYRGVRELGVEAVRIVPGFHGYRLDAPEVVRLCAILRELGLPLFLTLRMEDERQSYLLYPRMIPTGEIASFIDASTDIPILLCNIRYPELIELKERIYCRPDIFADFSGLKNQLFLMDDLERDGLLPRMVYGSLALFFCLNSTLFMAEERGEEDKMTRQIMSGDAFLKILTSAKTAKMK